MTFRVLLIAVSLAATPACSTPAPETPAKQAVPSAPVPEARSLSGQDLVPPVPIPNQAKLEADLAAAEAALAAQPDSAEALIWVGRRQGYLWRYRAAIDTFTRVSRKSASIFSSSSKPAGFSYTGFTPPPPPPMAARPPDFTASSTVRTDHSSRTAEAASDSISAVSWQPSSARACPACRRPSAR